MTWLSWIDGAALIATFLGVAAAFTLDRLVDVLRDRRERKREASELAEIQRLLVDAVQFDVGILMRWGRLSLKRFVGVDDIRVGAAGFRLSQWRVNATRYAALSRDVQEKTDFALFFEELERMTLMASWTGALQIGGSVPASAQFGASQEIALDLGKKLIARHGSEPQQRWARDNYAGFEREYPRLV